MTGSVFSSIDFMLRQHICSPTLRTPLGMSNQAGEQGKTAHLHKLAYLITLKVVRNIFDLYNLELLN